MARACESQGTSISSYSPTTQRRQESEVGRPKPEGGAPHSPTIDGLVQLFYKSEFTDEVGITVSEVFKGGSLGQGTHVKYKYDIDLIIYSRDLTEEEPVVSSRLFSKIVNFLDKHYEGVTKYEYRKSWYLGEKVIMGITFTCPLYEDETIEVDLSLSPYYSDHHHLLTVVQNATKKKRKWFSASKWQTDFIAKQDQWVKEFCRRFKAWRDLQWDDTKQAGCPKSYFLSLLVIIVYDGMPDDMKQSRLGNQRGQMKKLVSPMTEGVKALIHKVKADLDYKLLDLTVPVPEPYTSIRETYKDLLPPCPRIPDPINPSKNLYGTGIYGVAQGRDKWASFIEKIETLDLSPNIIKLHEERFKP